jgi:flagellar basal body P-ring formation protein FlgA
MSRSLKRSMIPTLFILLMAVIAQASAGAFQAHQSIISVVEAYLSDTFAQDGDKLLIEVTPLDHRLRLTRCETPLTAFEPPGGVSIGRTTVGVSCQRPKPWSLYVSANVGVELPVVIAKRDIPRGAPIGNDDLALEVMDTAHLLRGHYTAIAEVTGQTLKRTLRRGQVVTPSMLKVRKTVRRGDQITILAGSGPIAVRGQGKALRDGNPGDLIPVVNLSSKKELKARVVSPGLVSVQ